MSIMENGTKILFNITLYPDRRDRVYTFQLNGEHVIKNGRAWYMQTPKGFRKAYYAVEESPNCIHWYSTDCVTILRYYDD